jgi:cobalt-zinc-cadmium efflux system outer membrane protein
MWICASALAAAHGLYAQERLTAADAVAEAVARHPLVLGAVSRVAMAEGFRRQAGLAPNPRLLLQTENARFHGTPAFSFPRDSDTFAVVSQEIETGGKRRRRVDLAEQGVRRSELERELLRRQIAARVLAAYWTAAGAARHRDLLREEVASFDGVVQFHRTRVEEGAAAEVDLIRVQVERDRLSSAARAAEQEAETARIALLRDMGRTEFPPVEFADAVDTPPSVTVLTADQVLDRRPEMSLSRAAIDHARANLRLQQANSKVNPEAQLGYKRASGFDTLFAAVTIPLPVRNRNQGLIEAAAAEIKAAESSLAATEALVRSEVESALKSYQLRQALLKETLLPMRDRSDEVYRIAGAAYREGGSDILRLLDAERTRIEARLAYTKVLVELQQSAAALAAAQGNLP